MVERQDNQRRNRIVTIVVLVGTIIAAHYSIKPDALIYHNMLRRGMYVPIILAAVWFGTKGGVGVALSAAALYAPHLFLQQRLTSTDEIDSAVEMFLYLIVGGLTGLLAERQKWQREQTERGLAELQQAHDELRQQKDRLTETQEGLRQVERLSTLGELAADLAHEIRNPLAAMRGTVQILTREFPPQHEKHEFAQIVIQELDRLNAVLERYLHTARSRSTSGGQSDAIATLKTVVELIKAQAQRSEVTVELHGPDRIVLAMDAGQLTQVFMNLALNAIQSMPRGGVLRVDCHAEPGPSGRLGWAEITFADTGIGITPEHRQKIFQPFFTTKASGTGLGLSIARRLVEEHGGSVTLEKTSESGSVFRVRLPVSTP